MLHVLWITVRYGRASYPILCPLVASPDQAAHLRQGAQTVSFQRMSHCGWKGSAPILLSRSNILPEIRQTNDKSHNHWIFDAMHASLTWIGTLLVFLVNASVLPPRYDSRTMAKNDSTDVHFSDSMVTRHNESSWTPRLPNLASYPKLEARPVPPWPVVRHVTGTRTVITAHIQPQPIQPEAIGWTIKKAQYEVEGVMTSSGDGWLPARRDPYWADFGYGCYVLLGSSKTPAASGVRQQLTWGILNSTFEGLFNIAYVQGYSQEMRFDVMDSSWGTVSHGVIKAGTLIPRLEKGNGTGKGASVE